MTRAKWMAAAILAGLAAVPPAFAQGKDGLPRYEPTQRLRTALDTCLKDEVMSGPQCVKKCQPGFQLDAKAKKPVCVGLKPSAKYTPEEPKWKPSGKPSAPGAPGA